MEPRRTSVRGALALLVVSYSGRALAVDCFIDSEGGNDANTGLTEDQAVKTQAKIPKSCTVARYKRGSQFAEKVAIGGSIKTYTNYGDSCAPLPRFVMPGTTNTGPVVSAYQGGITIDGLYLANSHGDGSSSGSNFGKGTCVMLGGNSIMQNCEITSCDIGVMLSGKGSKFLNNYVHDLSTMIADAPQSSGININAVGGAEAIFVNGSDNEVAYNQFINCTGVSQWTGGGCDGGATEVSIGNNSTVSGVKIHHNFAYNTCGFFEVSSGTQGGVFADSEFYNNVSVDSGWMFLFQVNNTELSNIRWENNTIIYHKSADSSYPPVVSMIYNGTGTAGAGNAKMGTVEPNTVFFNNNLVLFAGFSSTSTLDKNISQSNNLITAEASGVVKQIGASGTAPSPSDFDLVDGSPAIDKGLAIAGITVDFLNRAVPAAAAPDIGAFEHNASTASGQNSPVATMDIVNGKVSGGCASPVSGNGGTPGVSGSSTSNGPGESPKTTQGTGGQNSAIPATKANVGGKSGVSPSNQGTGGQPNSASVSDPADADQQGTLPGTSSPTKSDGTKSTTSPTDVSDSTAAGGTSQALGTTSGGDVGCMCKLAYPARTSAAWGLLGLAALGLLRFKRRVLGGLR